MHEHATTDLAVSARGLGLAGPRGAVYTDVDLDLSSGEVVALDGPAGSGRTALLLTLAARMKPSRGTLVVLGHALPKGRRDVQHHTAIAHLTGIDDLDEGLTVGELFEERAGLSVPLWRRPLRYADPLASELAAAAFGAGDEVPWDTLGWQLTPLQRLQTCLLLALVGSPRLVVVDDVDAVREPRQQHLAWSSLARVADRGITVVGATTGTDVVPAGIRIVTLTSPANPDQTDQTDEANEAPRPTSIDHLQEA